MAWNVLEMLGLSKKVKEEPKKKKSPTIKKKKRPFSKSIKSEVITLSTLEKKSVSQIKAKLISYVS